MNGVLSRVLIGKEPPFKIEKLQEKLFQSLFIPQKLFSSMACGIVKTSIEFLKVLVVPQDLTPHFI
jgi:hypothetical protein